MAKPAYDIALIAERLLGLYPKAEVLSVSERNVYSKYANDPVGFGQDILGEEYTDDVKKLMESVRDNIITVARSANATGKTHGAARVATWFYKTHRNCQVYTAAAPPEENLRKLLWGEIGSLVHRHPAVFKTDTIRDLNIQRSPLEFITGVTIPSAGTHAERVAKFSGKHAEHLLFILDEGDAIPDSVYEGIESCMSGGVIIRLLIMFNPRAEIGEVYRMENEGRANVVELSAFNHPNVVTGENIIPGAVTRSVTIIRINEWCRPLNKAEKIDSSNTFKLPDFMVGLTAPNKAGGLYGPLISGYYVIMESAFSYMVLGKYPAHGTNQLISREWINAARSRWDAHIVKFGERPSMGTTCVLGIDVADDGEDKNVACTRWGGFVERFIEGDNVWGGVDVLETGDRAHAIYKKKRCLAAMVDGTGVGAGVAPHMRRLGCNALSVKVANSPSTTSELGEFKILRDQLLWAMRQWLKTDTGSMLPPDDMLIEELLCFTYKVQDGKVRVKKREVIIEELKRSPDKASALALTFCTEKIPKPFNKPVPLKRSNYVWS